jgi:hypothetical protein
VAISRREEWLICAATRGRAAVCLSAAHGDYRRELAVSASTAQAGCIWKVSRVSDRSDR